MAPSLRDRLSVAFIPRTEQEACECTTLRRDEILRRIADSARGNGSLSLSHGILDWRAPRVGHRQLALKRAAMLALEVDRLPTRPSPQQIVATNEP